jgi:hypothetical protein
METRAQERVPHLGTALGKAWHGSWCPGRLTRRALTPVSSSGGGIAQERASVGEMR